jgi:hypothetical protein
MKINGWIYDAYTENSQLTFWMKTQDKTLQLHDQFPVEIYATPRKCSLNELFEIISNHPLVESTTTCLRYVKINDEEKSEVIKILAKPQQYRKLILDLQSSGICNLYNTELTPVQRYFFNKSFMNFDRVGIEYDDKFRIIQINEEDYPTALSLNVHHFTSEDEKEDIDSKLVSEEFQILVIERSQRPIIYRTLRLQTGFSKSYARLAPGKLIMDEENFRNLGIAGLDEKSKFAVLPIGVIAAWGPARTIDSRQCYEALNMGILIPSSRAGSETNILTAKEVAYTDRGALILSPRIGLHENVGELDFESLFPNILVKHNVSYETTTANGTDQTKQGFLVELAEKFIQKRLAYKHEKKKFAENGKEWTDYNQRELLLKKLLVSLYGYSGSDLNRFGNAFAYREINRIGRETIIRAMNIAMNQGYQLIYLDTDSIFVKRQNAKLDDFKKLAETITDIIGFQIAVANHYRYLVLLTQEADSEIEAARRFYGKLTTGKVHYKGIELKRHDYPTFLKHFQLQLLNIILDAEKADDLQKQQFPKAIEFTLQTIEEIRSGKVPVSDLAISKVLRMPVERYRSLFPHVTAAVQLRQKHKPVKTGDIIDYVYVDTTQINPMNRVSPAKFAETYDVEKYTEIVLDVAESILGVFGFSRTQLGFQNRPRNFLDELHSERMREILIELENLQQ